MQFHYADPSGAFHPVFVRFEGEPVLTDPQDSAVEFNHIKDFDTVPKDLLVVEPVKEHIRLLSFLRTVGER